MRSPVLNLKLLRRGLMVLVLLAGCERSMETDGGEIEGRASEDVTVVLKPSAYVDSAQVLFFKVLGTSDTLIGREVIYDIEYMKPHTFHFKMPAGEYAFWVFGNVPTDYIAMKAPYSSEDVYLDYSQGRKPGAVCYGKNYLNFGVDTLGAAGMLLLVSSIKLTIQKVPEGISRIIVQILNTASGFTLNSGYIKSSTTPPLADTLKDIQRDSSYVSSFYCFPGAGTDENSTLAVDCYNVQNEVVFSGHSAPFQARYGYNMVISCSFASSRTMTGKKQGQIYFRIEQ